MSRMSVTLDVSKCSSWSNAVAPANMSRMSVTLNVAKHSGWLNTTAPRNMALMSVTLDVSKAHPASMSKRALRAVATLEDWSCRRSAAG
eukprot:scaffold32186_cov48-Phaeocystis_antarctica.AAC.1